MTPTATAALVLDLRGVEEVMISIGVWHRDRRDRGTYVVGAPVGELDVDEGVVLGVEAGAVWLAADVGTAPVGVEVRVTPWNGRVVISILKPLQYGKYSRLARRAAERTSQRSRRPRRYMRP